MFPAEVKEDYVAEAVNHDNNAYQN